MQPSTRDALLDLLQDHVAADADEATDLARIRALILESAAPTSRDQFAPGHLTASAVLVDPARERTLLIKHRKLGLWLQPGGHFEPDEVVPAAAALREVQEETGLAGRALELLDVDVHAIPARKQDPAHEHFDLRFLVEVPLAAPSPATAPTPCAGCARGVRRLRPRPGAAPRPEQDRLGGGALTCCTWPSCAA
ncbi:MAG: NUDIX domain-containing protein [Planctomycetota bacterium]